MAEISIEKALGMVKDEYLRAVSLPFVENPLAYALYRVWRRADINKQNRRKLDERYDADMR